MPPWLSWIAAGLAWLIRTFINRTPAAVAEGEKLGAAQAKLQEAKADAADVSKAIAAANASRAASADPGSLRDPSDPDCRDCSVGG